MNIHYFVLCASICMCVPIYSIDKKKVEKKVPDTMFPTLFITSVFLTTAPIGAGFGYHVGCFIKHEKLGAAIGAIMIPAAIYGYAVHCVDTI